MTEHKKRIGLFGGTFAPPHLGHVHAVRTLLDSVQLDEVIIMPTFMPPHKVKVKGDTPELRLEMCRAAFGGLPNVTVSDYEIERGGVSYTVHTLEHLSTELDADIYLLCGSDMFLTLDTWFEAERIFHLAHIVCVPRDTESTEALYSRKRIYEEKYSADVTLIGSDPFEVSSTEIRRMIADGENLSALLPKGVIEVIEREKMYNETAEHEELVLTDADIAELKKAVKPYLTQKRYLHTLAVAEEAETLAGYFMPEKANKLRAAALLHDITKRADEKKQLQYCEEFGIIIGNSENYSIKTIHAVTGAELARRDFAKYTDDEILSGVRHHTTGTYGMTVFDAIIYLADYIEKTRDFSDCVELRNYFYGRIDNEPNKYAVLVDTMIYALDMTVGNLLKSASTINYDTVGARNFFLTEKARINMD